MKFIQYLILRFGLFSFFFLVTSPIPIGLVFVIKYLVGDEKFRMLKWIIIPAFLAWFFGVTWLANRAAQHMAFEDRKFGDAVK